MCFKRLSIFLLCTYWVCTNFISNKYQLVNMWHFYRLHKDALIFSFGVYHRRIWKDKLLGLVVHHWHCREVIGCIVVWHCFRTIDHKELSVNVDPFYLINMWEGVSVQVTGLQDAVCFWTKKLLYSRLSNFFSTSIHSSCASIDAQIKRADDDDEFCSIPFMYAHVS